MFAVPGLRVQAAAFRSGGQRKLPLPESGPDPTDADTLEAFRARRRELSGERRLVLAVFMGALDDLRRYPRGSRQHTDAVRWVLNDDEGWPLSFRPACTTLDLDPDAVRVRVRAALAAEAAPLGTLGSRGRVYRGRAVCEVA